MSKKRRGLTAAAFAASALFAAQPAAADVIEINNWWAGASAVHIDFTGIDWHTRNAASVHEDGGAGGFLTYNLTAGGRDNGFQSFCVDIFHSFGFVVDSNDTLQPATIISAQAAADLGQLYTNHHNQIDSHASSALNESAFQLAVWEIVNEGSGTYNIGAGNFSASALLNHSAANINLAQTWLGELSTPSVSNYVANIWRVGGDRSGVYGPQDLVVFAPVPEPETYAMMLVGLGLLGFSARRKSQF